MINSEHILKG